MGLTEFTSIASLVVVLSSIAGLVIYSVVRRQRAEDERSARSAIVDELTARKDANERMGRERDQAVAEAGELSKRVVELEARTDLTALSQQIAVTTKDISDQIARTTEATTTSLVEMIEEHDRRVGQRMAESERRVEERHRELIGLIGSTNANITQAFQERRT
jgi:hypothetical protein